MTSFYRPGSNQPPWSTQRANVSRWARLVATLFSAVLSLAAADSATIVDSGSTNTAGFQIEVSRSGKAVYTPKPQRSRQLNEGPTAPPPGPVNRQISSRLVKNFFSALDRAKSLSAQSSSGCMKSASFGVTRTVGYRGQDSPDLTCGDRGNARLKALIQSTDEIIKVFRN